MSDPAEAIACASTAGPKPKISRIANANVVDVVMSCASLLNVTRTGNSSPRITMAVSTANSAGEPVIARMVLVDTAAYATTAAPASVTAPTKPKRTGSDLRRNRSIQRGRSSSTGK